MNTSINLLALKQRDQLPKEAGGARIVFAKNRRNPRLEGRRIVLPRPTREARFIPLQGGKQFLFVKRMRRRNNPNAVWFAGMDEQHPFVTAIYPPYHGTVLLRALNKGGEAPFYELLKPYIIRRLEAQYQGKARRQGDFWFFKLPHAWRKFQAAYAMIEGEAIERERVSEKQLFDTQHRLTGKYAEAYFYGWHCVLGEGAVMAPHHAPQVLKGLHVIVDTRGD